MSRHWRKIDPDRLKKIAAGRTARELAEIFDVTPQAIRYVCNRDGIRYKKAGASYKTRAKKDRNLAILRLRREGETIHAIARKMKISPQRVHQVLTGWRKILFGEDSP